MNWSYETCCVNSTAAKIHAMVDRAREITYRTFARYVTSEHLAEVFPWYTWGPGRKGGLRFKDDFAIAYYRSEYNGRKCVYINHSAIEYIFTA